MRYAMICRKKHQVLALANFCIEVIEKVTQVFIKAQISIFSSIEFGPNE